MRANSSGRRSRNRGGNRNRNTPNRSQVFDSNGPDVRIRGTAHQVHEKYMALAKDANSSGDNVLAQSYLQHAEHYQRLINSWNEEDAARQQQQQQQATHAESQKPTKEQDDLGLPDSILTPTDEYDQKQTMADA